MELKNWERFYDDDQKHVERVKAVGSLNLVPNTGRKGYILASIDVINKHLGRSVWLDELEEILRDVVKYKLWDWIEDNEVVEAGSFQYRSTAYLRRDITETLAHLNDNGLIDGILNVTDLGREFLTEVIVPHNPIPVIDYHSDS